jgi:hypothetical protein
MVPKAYFKNRGLAYAKHIEAPACTPPESKNMSTSKPRLNASIKNNSLLLFTGKSKIKIT